MKGIKDLFKRSSSAKTETSRPDSAKSSKSNKTEAADGGSSLYVMSEGETEQKIADEIAAAIFKQKTNVQ